MRTLIPHGSVCSSMMRCRSSLRRSRSESRVSSSALPSTERSVVFAISEVARDGPRCRQPRRLRRPPGSRRRRRRRGHVVARDDVLRGDRVGDRAQGHADHAVGDRHEEDQARTLLRHQATEAEHDAPLVFPQHAHRRSTSDNAKATRTARTIRTAIIQCTSHFSAGRTVRVRPSIDSTTTALPSASGIALLLEIPHAGAPERAVELHLTNRRWNRPHRRYAASECMRTAANGKAASGERLRHQQPAECRTSERDRDTRRDHGAAGRAGIRECEYDPGGQGRHGSCRQQTMGRQMCFRDHQRSAQEDQNDAEADHYSALPAACDRLGFQS